MADLAIVLGSVCGVSVSLLAIGLGILLRRRFCPAPLLTSGSEEDGSSHELPTALGVRSPASAGRLAPTAWEDGREASDSFLSTDDPAPTRTLSLTREVLGSPGPGGAPSSPRRQPTALALLIAANTGQAQALVASAGEACSSRCSSRGCSRQTSPRASPRLQPAPMPGLAEAAPSLAC